MGQTPLYALPYPELAESAEIPTDMHELASAVEAAIGTVVNVYEVDNDPGAVMKGSLWIETDVQVGYGPMWVKLTQAQYAALTPDPTILYIIVG